MSIVEEVSYFIPRKQKKKLMIIFKEIIDLAQLKLAKIPTKNGKLADYLFQKVVKTTNCTFCTKDKALLRMLNKVAFVKMVKFFKETNLLIQKIVMFAQMNAVFNMLPVNSGAKTRPNDGNLDDF